MIHLLGKGDSIYARIFRRNVRAFLSTGNQEQHHPPDGASDEVRRDVHPDKRIAQQRCAKLCCAKLRQPPNVHQLHELQSASHQNDANGNPHDVTSLRQHSKRQQNPEQHIRDTASVLAPPVRQLRTIVRVKKTERNRNQTSDSRHDARAKWNQRNHFLSSPSPAWCLPAFSFSRKQAVH